VGSISQYAAGSDRTVIEPDVYPATITNAAVLMENGKAKINKYGKTQIAIGVLLDNEVGPDGGPVELRRTLSISYGRNNASGNYSELAKLIEAACDVACGDAAQRHVTTEQLIGKHLRVQTTNTDKDGRIYTNIAGFLAPRKAPAQFVHQPKPVEQPDYGSPDDYGNNPVGVGQAADPAEGDDSWPDSP